MAARSTALIVAALMIWGCGSTAKSDGDATDTTTPDGTDIASDTIPTDTGTDSAPADTIPDTIPPDGPPPDGPLPDGPPPDGPLPDGPPPDGPPPDGPPPSGDVGDPCSAPTDCTGVPGSGRDCLTDISGMISFPGGYCSASCTTDTECGTGGECVDFFGYAAYCLKVCTSGSDCRTSEGYLCDSIPGSPGTSTYCLPPFGGPDGGPVDP